MTFIDAYRDGYLPEESITSQFHTQFALRGTRDDGIEVYETSDDVLSMSWADRKAKFVSVMENEYRGRTAKFIRNGHAYYAKFEKADVSKNIYGDKRSDKNGWKSKVNEGADGSIFELVENSKYNGSDLERGKPTSAHKGISYWDYFVKTVQINNRVFDLVANVRKNYSDEYVYSIQLNENKKIKAVPFIEVDKSPRQSNETTYMLNVSQSEAESQAQYHLRESNLGYHAGDLGKAEYLKQQSYSRGTGHFGTGTYFVGEEAKVTKDSYYGKRPQHAVDFSDYKLYKVRNDRQGYRLHDALRVIDGGINANWILPAANMEYSAIDSTEYYKIAKEISPERYYEDSIKLEALKKVAEKYGLEIPSKETYVKEDGYYEPEDEFFESG